MTVTVPEDKKPGDVWTFPIPNTDTPKMMLLAEKVSDAALELVEQDDWVLLAEQVSEATIELVEQDDWVTDEKEEADIPQDADAGHNEGQAQNVQQNTKLPEEVHTYSVELPDGVTSGQTVRMEVEESVILALTIPADKKSGDVWTFDVPNSEVDAAKKYAADLPTKTYTVAIPEGVVPGQKVRLLVEEGVILTLTIPEDKTSGDVWTFDAPSSEEAAPEVSSAEKAKPEFKAEIPEGLATGETFTVQVGDKIVTLTVPDGKNAGDSLVFGVPADDTLSDSEQKSEIVRQTYITEIPLGVSPGDAFEVQVAGKAITLVVPEGKTAGETMKFDDSNLENPLTQLMNLAVSGKIKKNMAISHATEINEGSIPSGLKQSVPYPTSYKGIRGAPVNKPYKDILEKMRDQLLH